MGASYSATKLKVQLKSATSRMTMSINKRNNGIRIDSRAVASLLQQQKDESARIKVEGLIHAKNLVTVMETLQLMCELLSTRIAIISNSQSVPPDLEESIATIVYCAQRVEIDELTAIAHQLAAKYGEKQMRLHCDDSLHRVNPRVLEKLRIQTPDFALIIASMQDIAAQYGVDWKPDLSVLDSGVRGSNPERLGAIAGGPTGADGGEYKEEDLHALPTVGTGAAAGGGAAAALGRADEGKAEEEKRGGDGFSQPPIKKVPMPDSSSSASSSLSASAASPPPAFSPAGGAAPPQFSPPPSSAPSSSFSPPPPTYPGTLNVIVLQARDVPAASPDSPSATYVKISEPSSSAAWHWVSKPALPSSSSLLRFPANQHCPLSVTSASQLIVVEVVRDGGAVLGGLSIEAEQMRRSVDGTWYTVFSSHAHQPRGQVLLASQYMPLQQPGGGGGGGAVGAGGEGGEEPVYHSMAAMGGAPGGAPQPPPAYDGSGGGQRVGMEDEREGQAQPLMREGETLQQQQQQARFRQ